MRKAPLSSPSFKYEALRYAEELASVANSSGDPKAVNYDIIASTLREKLYVPTEQFKVYFLALFADKDFSRVIDTVSKVDESFCHSLPSRAPSGKGKIPVSAAVFPTVSQAASPRRFLQVW